VRPLFLPVPLFLFVVVLFVWDALLSYYHAVAGHTEFQDKRVMDHAINGSCCLPASLKIRLKNRPNTIYPSIWVSPAAMVAIQLPCKSRRKMALLSGNKISFGPQSQPYL